MSSDPQQPGTPRRVDRRPGVSIQHAAQVLGFSKGSVRKWVDNWIAADAGDAGAGLPRLRGWRTHPNVASERRVDPEDLERLRRELRGDLSGGEAGRTSS